MKIFLISILLTTATTWAGDRVPASELYPAVVEIANKYGVESSLVLKVIFVESMGDPAAYNRATDDHGLMQIHGATARSMGVSKTCLYAWRCNLDIGVRILSSLNRVCRYNVGSGVLKGDKLRKCLIYEEKLHNVHNRGYL